MYAALERDQQAAGPCSRFAPATAQGRASGSAAWARRPHLPLLPTSATAAHICMPHSHSARERRVGRGSCISTQCTPDAVPSTSSTSSSTKVSARRWSHAAAQRTFHISPTMRLSSLVSAPGASTLAWLHASEAKKLYAVLQALGLVRSLASLACLGALAAAAQYKTLLLLPAWLRAEAGDGIGAAAAAAAAAAGGECECLTALLVGLLGEKEDRSSTGRVSWGHVLAAGGHSGAAAGSALRSDAALAPASECGGARWWWSSPCMSGVVPAAAVAAAAAAGCGKPCCCLVVVEVIRARAAADASQALAWA